MYPLCTPTSVLPGSRPHWARPIISPHHQLQDSQPHSITSSIPLAAPEAPGSIATPAPEPPNSILSPSPCPFSQPHFILSPHQPSSPSLPLLGAHHPPSPPHIWSGPRGRCSGCTHPLNQLPPSPAARGSPSTSYLPEPAGTTFLEHPTSSHPPSTPGGCKPAGPRASCRSWDGGSRPPSCGGSTGESRAAPQQRWLWGELGRALLRACVCVWLQDLILFRTPDRHRWAAGTKA